MKDKIITVVIFILLIVACVAGCLWDKIRFTVPTSDADLERRIERLERIHEKDER
jgi:hypothetical protein